MIYLNSATDNFRAFKVDEGMDNSFGVKLDLLIRYIETDP